MAKLVAFGSLILLATVSPASSTAGHGRWPLYWAERFAPHGWRFVDAIRPAIWNDSLVHPDVKEGALLFVGPRATVPEPPSGASALLHPHRLVEVQRGFNSRLDRFRREIQERDRADLDALTGEAQGQRQRLLALEARVAAAERRTGLLADGLLHAPCFQPISATRGLRSRVRHLLRAAPVALTAAASLPDLATSSLFDPAYYVEHNPDAAAAPFVHYLAQGEHRGRRPNRYFDPTFYRETQPDVAASALGMLAHFARYGGFEGRAASPEFDTAWYVSTYRDVGLSGLHPLLHFLAIGQTLGYQPGPAS